VELTDNVDWVYSHPMMVNLNGNTLIFLLIYISLFAQLCLVAADKLGNAGNPRLEEGKCNVMNLNIDLTLKKILS
jgi:hypothetical protein